MLDSGATISTFPLCRIPQNVRHAIRPTCSTLRGIGGNADLAGEITASIYLGSNSTAPIRDVTILVTRSNNPVLIGQNVLKDDTIRYWHEDNTDGKIKFCRLGVQPEYHAVEVLSKEALQNEFNGLSQHSTFKEKSDWLKTNKNVKLPEGFKRHETEALVDLLLKHKDVLGTDDNDPGTFVRSVSLPTNGKSKSVGQFPIAEALREKFDAELAKMESEGIIEPCSDPKGFNSPAFPVLKKNGNIRVVVNFKPTLNQCLVDLDPWPLPTIDELMAKIGTNNKYFASVDLRSGYFQIPINPEDRHKTAFMHNGRCMQFSRLAMGITSAGNIFCRSVGEALEGIPDRRNICTYSDDNLVFAPNFKRFFEAMDKFLAALQEFGLKVNPAKCIFMSREAEFLGRVVSSEGFGPNKDYVQGIRDMAAPTTKKEAMSLVGRLVWIRQFLETRLDEQIKLNTFAEQMTPIHETIKEGRNFRWTSEADKAFTRIKHRLTTTPIISFADYNLPFTLTCDASDKAAGAVLMQETPAGKKRIIGAISKKFNKTEQNWSATEREAFAIKWSIKKFDYFLKARPFVLFTDHKSLVYLDQKHFNNSKISRWQDEISTYRFQVQYLEGHSNVFADMLSRPTGTKNLKQENDPTPAGTFYRIKDSGLQIYVPSWATKELNGKPIEIEHVPYEPKENIARAYFNMNAGQSLRARNRCHLATSQYNDPFLRKIIDFLRGRIKISVDQLIDKNDHRFKIYRPLLNDFTLDPGTDALTIKSGNETKLVIPYTLRAAYLHEVHDNTNHAGETRVKDLLKPYWWESKTADIHTYIKSCILCAKRKGRYGKRQDWKDGHCKRGSKPFEVIYTDFVHMPRSKGKAYILTILDSYSRYFIAIPTAHDRAIDAARGIYQLFLRHRVIPDIVSSDRGTHFTSETYKKFCEHMGIRHELHCPWRPQSSGNIERQHRTMKNAIFILTNERRCEWTDVLESVVSNMNATINQAIRTSPHFVLTGRKPDLALPKLATTTTKSPAQYGKNIQNVLRAVKNAVEIANKEADHTLDKRSNGRACKNLLEAGDQILVYRPQSAEAKRTKLAWIGPMTVMATNDMVLKVRDASGETSWIHRAHIRPVTARPQNLISDIPPIPEFVEDEIFNTPSGGQRNSERRVSNIPTKVVTRPSHLRRKPKRLIDIIDPSLKSYDETFTFLPPPPEDFIEEPSVDHQIEEWKSTTTIDTVSSYPSTIWPDNTTEEAEETELIEDINDPSPAEDRMAFDTVSVISEAVTIAAPQQAVDSEQNGICAQPIVNDFVELNANAANSEDDHLLSIDELEDIMKNSKHFIDRCLYDIKDRDLLNQTLRHYNLEPKKFKAAEKKREEIRQAIMSKPNASTNFETHTHDNLLWPIPRICFEYSRSSAKAQRTTIKVSQPGSTKAKSTKMYILKDMSYHQLIWLHIQFKIPVKRCNINSRASILSNIENNDSITLI